MSGISVVCSLHVERSVRVGEMLLCGVRVPLLCSLRTGGSHSLWLVRSPSLQRQQHWGSRARERLSDVGGSGV